MPLDTEAAARAVSGFARGLNHDPDGAAGASAQPDTAAAAWGIHRLVNENMANAARVHAAERGLDVASFAMVATGGAGPVHACKVAELLGMETVIVPDAAGVSSAAPQRMLPEGGTSRLPALAPRPEEGPLRLVGLGASVRVTRPSEATLGGALAVGPLLRLRPRNGMGPAIAFNWTNTEIETGPTGRPGLAAIQLRPVMAGVEYGVVRGRLAVGASAVGGYSFNRLGVDTAWAGPGRAIAVGNGFVWRPGAVLWADVTPRVGVNVFGGYLFARPKVTFASDASIATERVNAGSVVVSVGVAYWIF